ncbi:hypothetical protein F7725_022199 [Dissostichus mawsoni]|uniref:Uncharacterized protein n=1 Tax=Dissostichus mawsoni TaxID=36200 RepID=A0A7J5YX19_DISMA|nr:hypothetical protein F7725_022199 [Dissostichus mawsoni]
MGGWVERKKRKKKKDSGGKGPDCMGAFNNKRKEWSAQTLFTGGGEWVEIKNHGLLCMAEQLTANQTGCTET